MDGIRYEWLGNNHIPKNGLKQSVSSWCSGYSRLTCNLSSLISMYLSIPPRPWINLSNSWLENVQVFNKVKPLNIWVKMHGSFELLFQHTLSFIKVYTPVIWRVFLTSVRIFSHLSNKFDGWVSCAALCDVCVRCIIKTVSSVYLRMLAGLCPPKLFLYYLWRVLTSLTVKDWRDLVTRRTYPCLILLLIGYFLLCTPSVLTLAVCF